MNLFEQLSSFKNIHNEMNVSMIDNQMIFSYGNNLHMKHEVTDVIKINCSLFDK